LDTTGGPVSRSIIRLDDDLDDLALGWKKIPAGWPSGLCITSPDEGDVPNLTAASEKYSMPSDTAKGDGGGWLMASPKESLGERVDRSELVREPEALEVVGDLGIPVLKELLLCKPGLWGDVAMGTKK
jgi:hypothetical protein